MKKNKIALSNEVYEDEYFVCKKYLQNNFKLAIGKNDHIVCSLVNQNPTKIADGMFCFEKIEHQTFRSEDISFELINEVVKRIKQFHKLSDSKIKNVNFKKAWNIVKPFYKMNNEKECIVKDAFKLLNKNIVLLHNDIVDGNILILPNKKIELIDFEYSGYGNEMFDVASFLTERVIEQKYKDYFLKAYYGNKKYNKDELRIIIKFSIIFWSAWALYMFDLTKKRIYKQIHIWKEKEYIKY